MEKVMAQEQERYAVQKPPEARVRWSCMWPVSLVEVLQRYSEESGITQTHFVKKATEKALRELGLF